MRKYVCSVCGYDYDEKDGDKSQGIAPGTRFLDLPEDWVCPICGADKSMFELEGGDEPAPAFAQPAANESVKGKNQDMKQRAIMISNLAKAASKQHNAPMASLCARIGAYFEQRNEASGDMKTAHQLLNEDISTRYIAAFNAAREAGDRGALRALTWGEKVTKIQANIINRYQKDGDKAFENDKIFVCEACGFIFVGEEAPEICPVCKVPRFKFNQVKRGA
ncbi:MAG: rubredoxin [Clostridiales bacterium]|nr:rubredoxin [Clostridiales bacterium]